jgi:hypothetical protein
MRLDEDGPQRHLREVHRLRLDDRLQLTPGLDAGRNGAPPMHGGALFLCRRGARAASFPTQPDA